MMEYENCFIEICKSCYYNPCHNDIIVLHKSKNINDIRVSDYLKRNALQRKKSLPIQMFECNNLLYKFVTMSEIILTDDCNMNCTYCYSAHYRERSYINIENAHAVVDRLFENARLKSSIINTPRKVAIMFHGGGEPTLAWKELVSIVEYSNFLSEKYNTKISYGIASNGTMDEAKLQFMLKNNFTFRISLDGCNEINDRTRRDVHGGSVYDIISTNLDILNRSNSTFTIACVITELNIDHIYDFATYCAHRWDKSYDIKFTPIYPTITSQANKLKGVQHDECFESIESITGMLISKKLGKYAAYIDICDYYLRNYYYPCRAYSGKSIVVNPSGSLWSCLEAVGVNNEQKVGEVQKGKIILYTSSLKHSHNDCANTICKKCICQRYCPYYHNMCHFLYTQINPEFCIEMNKLYKKMMLYKISKYKAEYEFEKSDDEDFCIIKLDGERKDAEQN